MDTNDLQDRASKLLRALEDGDAQRARDMLHGEDALDVALMLANAPRGSTERATLSELLSILAAERMARETLARTLGNPSGRDPLTPLTATEIRSAQLEYAERNRASLDHARATGEQSDVLKRATGCIVRDLAALDHGRAVAELYANDDDVEAQF